MKILFFFLLLLTSMQLFSQHRLRQVVEPESSYRVNDGYGAALGIDNNTMVVSSYYNDVAFIYEKRDGLWQFLQEIKPSDFTGNKYFGYKLEISGNTIMASASQENDNNGAVYFFEKNDEGVWEQSSKINSPLPSVSTTGDYWGGTLMKLNGKLAMATKGSGGYVNYVHLMEKQADNTWIISDSLNAGNGNFLSGRSPYLSDTLIILPGNRLNPAVVYLFSRRTTENEWSAPVKITPAAGGKQPDFGDEIAFNGNTIAVSSPEESVIKDGVTYEKAGRVYFFNKINDVWQETQQITAADPEQWALFGSDLEMENNTIIAGARYNDTNENYEDSVNSAGAFYIFKFIDNEWVHTQKFSPLNREVGVRFGQSLAFNNGTIAARSTLGIHTYEEGEDCMGVEDGAAFYDFCFFCAEGTSGHTPILDESNCIITGIQEELNESVVVAPNPFGKKGIQIYAEHPIAWLTLTDLTGRIRLQSESVDGLNNIGGNLPKGVYVLVLQFETGERVVKKVVKE